MPFVDAFFLWVFLPLVIGVYALVHGRSAPRAIREAGWSGVVLLGASVVFVAASTGLLPTRMQGRLPGYAVPLGVVIVGCHALSMWIDRRRGTERPDDHGTRLTGALFLLQFPLLVAGPIVRYHDFRAQLADRTVTLAATAYGVRRVVIGIIKVVYLAAALGAVADPVFGARPAALGVVAAWLGAAAAALQVYFIFSGYADVAIGISRMFGFRYPENFRRPYTADSLREFWRRWNVTLLTWLRDYAGLPIAGQERPTVAVYVKLIVGFTAIGWWHGAGVNAVFWGVLMGSLLALESAGFSRVQARMPRAARHAYVLAAATLGWAIARADTPRAAGVMLQAMAGLGSAPFAAGIPSASVSVWCAVALAVLLAGPLISSVSRWRVSVDAATTSAVMMVAATAVFVSRPLVRWSPRR